MPKVGLQKQNSTQILHQIQRNTSLELFSWTLQSIYERSITAWSLIGVHLPALWYSKKQSRPVHFFEHKLRQPRLQQVRTFGDDPNFAMSGRFPKTNTNKTQTKWEILIQPHKMWSRYTQKIVATKVDQNSTRKYPLLLSSWSPLHSYFAALSSRSTSGTGAASQPTQEHASLHLPGRTYLVLLCCLSLWQSASSFAAGALGGVLSQLGHQLE